MTYEQQVETVARAICDAALWTGAWEKANEVERGGHLHLARAALAALGITDTAPAPAISGLVEQIDALLDLHRKGVLVPPVPGLVIDLLNRSAAALAAAGQKP